MNSPTLLTDHILLRFMTITLRLRIAVSLFCLNFTLTFHMEFTVCVFEA
jgi:hypothetical protein